MTTATAPATAAPGRARTRVGGGAVPFLRYLGLRLVQAVVALWGVVTAVFFCLRLSGDPAQLLAPQGATREQIDQLRDTLGLNASTWSQYTSYLGDLVHGDLGYSFVQRRPAIDVITQRLPYTINLALAALVLSIVLGVGAGMVMALYRGRWPERVLTPLVLAGQAMPAFWTGILLILVFSVTFDVFPSTGDTSASSIVLPAVTLASLSAATVARVTRAAVLEQLNRDYVRTARSKGVGTWRLVWRHLLRNIAVPVLTVLALETANLLGGSVVTELIYAWPGLGQLTVQSVNARDFPVVQALVVLAAVVYILINLVTDLVYGVIDPRIAVTAKGAEA
ncbi:peptide/nickel transport system permease protein [Jatrophihabitans endophyticus]|uniref:Peptide/nickel transport system permease protein n=1 Tax=Jatrophihabitans endophyticus TaxID=1206085 RepID=A0A1M5S152_9ACTN|nr:ABC transporter permease [Jatrophihabitans endophyticus]SHH32169.1 peptide/nickel transport system permease protein [Jatrophihabitans endophyticus]